MNVLIIRADITIYIMFVYKTKVLTWMNFGLKIILIGI